jgi:hypothetical protein
MVMVMIKKMVINTQMNRHTFALLLGFIGGMIPNNKSNIYPPLMGSIFAILFSKIVFGDYDKGYQWSFSDLLFLIINGGEGFIGGLISDKIVKPWFNV